jgi:phage protein D
MPAGETTHLPQFAFMLDGQQPPDDLKDALIDCVVENTLHLPDYCVLRFQDAGFQWVDSDKLKEGVKVEIKAGYDADGLERLFIGEVIGLDLDMTGQGTPTVSVRCYDYSHRLHRGKKSRTFQQVTDADIAKKVGQEASFQVKTDADGAPHPWIIQNNQTNWEFLNERAERSGCRVFIRDERTLHFEKVQTGASGQGETVRLEWGTSLRSFRPRLSAGPQVNEVVVRGWEPKRKQAIIGRAQRAEGVPETQAGPVQGGNVAQQAFGEATQVYVDRPVHTQAEADLMARSLLDDISGGYMEAEGLAQGNVKIKPGTVMEVTNIGRRFSGKYHVTSTAHSYSVSEGYTTFFAVSGKKPTTLSALLQGDSSSASNGGGTGSTIVVGVVTDNKDPADQARVKVKYPHLTEDHTSYWVRLATPMAGPGRGFEFIPEIDDEVLVAFEHNDIHRAYVIGCLWNGKDKPPLPTNVAVAGGKVKHRRIQTRSGHVLDFNDDGIISIISTGGHKVLLQDGKEGSIDLVTDQGDFVSLVDGNGIAAVTKEGRRMVLSDKEDFCVLTDGKGNMFFIHGGNIVAESPSGTIQLKSMNLLLDATNIWIDAQANLALSAGANFLAKGGATAALTSPTTFVKGDGMASLEGGIVNINTPGPPPPPASPKSPAPQKPNPQEKKSDTLPPGAGGALKGGMSYGEE